MSVYFISEPDILTACNEHACAWCGQLISIGERYSHRVESVDGRQTSNDMHLECTVSLEQAVIASGGPIVYERGKNERPAA